MAKNPTGDLTDQFRLAKEPGYNAEKGKALGNGALVFMGSEILALARFCYTKGADQPVLITICEKGEGRAPHIYEGFKIGSLSLSDGGAALHFHGDARDPQFSLQLVPGKDSDPSGKVVSRIETLREYFPFKEYAAFRKTLLDRQVGNPPAPRA